MNTEYALIILTAFSIALLVYKTERDKTKMRDDFTAQKYFLIETFEKVYKDKQTDNIDLRNRLFVSKGLPPVGTDIKLEREKRMEADRQRKQPSNFVQMPNGTDPVKKAQMEAAQKEAEEMQKQAQLPKIKFEDKK